MGRELNRKQAKREGKNVKEAQKRKKDKPMEMKTFITIIVALLLCFVVLYILTGIFVTKDIKWFDRKTENEQVSNDIKNKILGVDSLKQNDDVYYVYFYDTKNEDNDISGTVNILMEKVYRVDLNDGFNGNFVGEPSGIVDDISGLKVSNPTVIKVENKQIVGFYNGEEINTLK